MRTCFIAFIWITTSFFGASLLEAQARFVRGDANDSGRADIADAILILSWLFLEGDTPACLDAADLNDDDAIDIADCVAHLFFVLLGAEAPSAPFPDCGHDPTPGELTCARFGSCPQDGVRLEGEPDAPAVLSFHALPPRAAPPEEVADGVLLSRLDVWFHPEATVGGVNDALESIDASIVSMPEGITVATVAVPLQPSADALRALADTLAAHPAVLFSFIGRTPEVRELPPGLVLADLFDLEFLLATRFPAAWNARSLALSHCTAEKVKVLVGDMFDASSKPADFDAQVPAAAFSLYDPDAQLPPSGNAQVTG